MNTFDISFYGTRGSVPASGPEYSIYGGNTPCVAVRSGGSIFILDAGTGIIQLGRDLKAQKVKNFDIFLTHAHYDHVQGLPFFEPLFDESVAVNFWYASRDVNENGERVVDRLLSQPFLPFSIDDIKCKISFKDLPHQGVVNLTPEITLKVAPLNHPGECSGLRFEANGSAFVYAPDFEYDDGVWDISLVNFMSGADLAVLDATYTADEYKNSKGFGHTPWQKTMGLAKEAQVKNWALFHHSHHRTDTQLAEIERQAKELDARSFIARDSSGFSIFSDECESFSASSEKVWSF